MSSVAWKDNASARSARQRPERPSSAAEGAARLNAKSFIGAYLQPQSGRVLLLSILILAVVALQLAGPVVVGVFIDTIVRLREHASTGQLWGIAATYVAVVVGAELARLVATYLGELVKWDATNLLRRDLATHSLGQDISFFETRTPGELIERVDGDVSTLASFFSQFVFQLLSSCLLLIGIIAVAFTRDYRAGLALLLFAGLAALVLERTRSLGKVEFQNERIAQAELTGFLEERLHGLEDIRANGGGPHVLTRLLGLNNSLADWSIKAWRLGGGVVVIANWVFLAGFAASLAVGVYLFRTGQGTLGTIYVLMQYSQMMRAPLEAIRTQIWDLRRVGVSIARIREYAGVHPKVRDGVGAELPTGPLGVCFEDVTFSYRSGLPALSALSFEIPPGAVLGLLGRTGSGKTTLGRMLARLYDPDVGSIRLGGIEATDARLADLRRRVALVTQDVQLLEASIRDNITLFDASVDDEELRLALDRLGLSSWLGRMPAGLDEVVHAGSSGLSAGEAQLLAFARVLLRRPGLVVLDEASSRLDAVTQQLVETAIDKLLGEVEAAHSTAIVVAHRLETVRRATHIMILECGRVVEFGERAALAAQPGSAFSRLLSGGLREVLA